VAGSPDALVVPAALQEPFRSALEAAATAWIVDLGDRLLSLVLFGSVARGQAHPRSDIDLLVVVAGFPRSLADRRRPLLAALPDGSWYWDLKPDFRFGEVVEL
jgi:predicted nucleotidyltransferase